MEIYPKYFDSELSEKHQEIVDLLDKKVSKSAIARVYGVNRGSLSNYINRFIEPYDIT